MLAALGPAALAYKPRRTWIAVQIHLLAVAVGNLWDKQLIWNKEDKPTRRQYEERLIKRLLYPVMLLAAGFVPSLVSLSALKSRALRRGAWFRVGPAAKALIDAAILYLKRGGRIKSPALAEALRKAAEEVLRLTTPIRVLAKAVGYAVARRLGVEVDEERATALGIQWLNTPRRWRRDVATP